MEQEIMENEIIEREVRASTEKDFLADVKKKSVTGAASYFMRTLLLQGLGFASILILSVFFEPEDFAVYGVVAQIIGLLVFFSDIGLAAALIQMKDEPSKRDYRTAFTIQQLLSWLIVGISGLIVVSGIVASKTGTVGNWILLSLAISFPLATLKTIPSILLERKLQFSKLVMPQIVEQVIFHGILIVLAWRGVGVLAYAYAIIFRSLAGVVVINFIQPWSIGLAFSKKSMKKLLGYGLKFQFNDLLARIKDQLFYLVLGWWLPLRQFGYIQWAKNWSMYPYNLTVQNVMAITFPTFSRLQGHKKALSRAIEISLFFITLSIFPILVGMAVIVTPVIELIPAYQKWMPAVFSLVMFGFSIGWSAISTPLTNTLNAIGHINQTLKLMLMWTGLTWVVTPIFVILFGYNGVALSALLISFTSILAVFMVKKYVDFKVIEQVWRQLLAATAMGLVGWWLQATMASSWLHIIVSGLLLVIIYGSIMLLFGWNKLSKEVRGVLKHVNVKT